MNENEILEPSNFVLHIMEDKQKNCREIVDERGHVA